MVRDGTASIHRRRAGKGAGNEADDPAAAFTESHGVLRRGHFREVSAARRVDLQRLQRRPGNQHPTRRGDELRPVDQPLRVYLVAGERQGDPEGPLAGGTAAEPAQQITVVVHHLGVGGALPGTANAAHPDVRLLIVAQALDPQRRIEGKRRDTRGFEVCPRLYACVFLRARAVFDRIHRESQLDRIDQVDGKVVEHGPPLPDFVAVRAAQQQAEVPVRTGHRSPV